MRRATRWRSIRAETCTMPQPIKAVSELISSAKILAHRLSQKKTTDARGERRPAPPPSQAASLSSPSISSSLRHQEADHCPAATSTIANATASRTSALVMTPANALASALACANSIGPKICKIVANASHQFLLLHSGNTKGPTGQRDRLYRPCPMRAASSPLPTFP